MNSKRNSRCESWRSRYSSPPPECVGVNEARWWAVDCRIATKACKTCWERFCDMAQFGRNEPVCMPIPMSPGFCRYQGPRVGRCAKSCSEIKRAPSLNIPPQANASAPMRSLLAIHPRGILYAVRNCQVCILSGCNCAANFPHHLGAKCDRRSIEHAGQKYPKFFRFLVDSKVPGLAEVVSGSAICAANLHMTVIELAISALGKDGWAPRAPHGTNPGAWGRPSQRYAWLPSDWGGQEIVTIDARPN